MTDIAKKAKVPDEYLAGYDGLKKDWISTSALSTAMMCGQAFKYRYIDRLPETASIRQSVGVAAHKGREHSLKQKVDSHVDLPIEEVTDATRDAIVEIFDNREMAIEKEFEGKSLADARDLAIDFGTEITALDVKEFHPLIQPTGVEASYAVNYPGLSRTIVGKIDVNVDLDGRSVVRDYKTGKQAFGQTKADESMQFSTYGLLKWATTGQLVDEYIVDNVTKGKTAAKSHIYTTTRTIADMQRQLDRFAAWIRAIDAGSLGPADPSSWKCSPNFCSYFHRCPYGGK